METRPRVFPLLFGALVASSGLSAALIEGDAVNWGVGGAIVLMGFSLAAFGAVVLRRS